MSSKKTMQFGKEERMVGLEGVDPFQQDPTILDQLVVMLPSMFSFLTLSY
jgi:hypothetical protein